MQLAECTFPPSKGQFFHASSVSSSRTICVKPGKGKVLKQEQKKSSFPFFHLSSWDSKLSSSSVTTNEMLKIFLIDHSAILCGKWPRISQYKGLFPFKEL